MPPNWRKLGSSLGSGWPGKAVLVLSLVGVLISAYLAYTKLAHGEPFCAGLGSCAQVSSSPYSEVKGVPVAVLGMGFYAVLAGLGVLRIRGVGGNWAPLALFGLSLGGVLYSAYLTYLELYVIRAVCLWCVASAAVVIAILGLSLVGLLAPDIGHTEGVDSPESTT